MSDETIKPLIEALIVKTRKKMVFYIFFIKEMDFFEKIDFSNNEIQVIFKKKLRKTI